MPKTKVPRGTSRRPDPEGEAWQANAAQRWRQAEHRARNAGGDFAPSEFFDPPPLPVFVGAAHVTRQLLGRYLHDRDTNVVHDVTHARESCAIDAIANGTFVHFAAEIAGAVPADAVDCACMTDESRGQ